MQILFRIFTRLELHRLLYVQLYISCITLKNSNNVLFNSNVSPSKPNYMSKHAFSFRKSTHPSAWPSFSPDLHINLYKYGKILQEKMFVTEDKTSLDSLIGLHSVHIYVQLTFKYFHIWSYILIRYWKKILCNMKNIT